MSLVLLVGGARSGKSEMAEAMATAESASSGAGVTYVPGSTPAEDDPDWMARIERHRRRRPSSWQTLEPNGDLGAVVRATEMSQRILVVDSLGTWLARQAEFDPGPGLVDALAGRSALTIVVSEEVGMGVHPSSASGRRFRDALGRLNAEVAAVADDVFLVVAGRRLRLDRP